MGLRDRAVAVAVVKGGGRVIGKWEFRRDFERGEVAGRAILG